MVKIIADNILSPLGATTADNLLAVRQCRSALRRHQLWQVPEPFVASLFPERDGRPAFEQLMLASIRRCLAGQELSGRVVLVLATTKGATVGPDARPLGESAQRVAGLLRPSLPHVSNLASFVVSNACISGLSALIVAQRLLTMGLYDYAIVTGCDVQSRFIVAGFQSFMALSPEPCRPFDDDRCGLNLGEAAATVLLQGCSAPAEAPAAAAPACAGWVALPGFMRNDAYHISTPSRTAEGSYLALTAALGFVPSPACISAHGTATLYNDEMEALAISRAAQGEVPVTALKGYFGHTMGAAGILESILTLYALQEGWVPGTLGFHSLGTSRPVRVAGSHQPLTALQQSGPSFVKLMSGFGGCNAAMGFECGSDSKGCDLRNSKGYEGILRDFKGQMCSLSVRITPQGATLCGEALSTGGATGRALLTALYRQYVGDYPKFYKMDLLSRLGFIAAELLMQREAASEPFGTHRAVLLFGHTASQAADRRFELTIQPGPDYFPSPADFVYTLPNIVTGEIAIRHQLHGETCYFALARRDDALIRQLVRQAFLDPTTTSVLFGWIDAPDDDHFDAELCIIKK